jgi:hypothetical protein
MSFQQRSGTCSAIGHRWSTISQLHSMELITVKIALGILTKDAQKKECNWASIGYVEKAPENDGRSRAMAKEANHLEEQDQISSQEDSESDNVLSGVGDKYVQDWHAMVSKILEGFVDLCEAGFMWDHFCKGQLYENIKCEVFVPFIRCNNLQGSRHNVCSVPAKEHWQPNLQALSHMLTRKMDRHLAAIVHKTKIEIQNLIQKGDLTRLVDLSQNYLLNVFCDLQFSLAND